MSVLLAVLSFIDIVALTFLNGYWVRLPRSGALSTRSLLPTDTSPWREYVNEQLITLDELELDHLNPADVSKRLNKLVCTLNSGGAHVWLEEGGLTAPCALFSFSFSSPRDDTARTAHAVLPARVGAVGVPVQPADRRLARASVRGSFGIGSALVRATH